MNSASKAHPLRKVSAIDSSFPLDLFQDIFWMIVHPRSAFACVQEDGWSAW
ncbi:MAG: hypothetical protein R3B48_17785 [Kofleriaceae bacterium]